MATGRDLVEAKAPIELRRAECEQGIRRLGEDRKQVVALTRDEYLHMMRTMRRDLDLAKRGCL